MAVKGSFEDRVRAFQESRAKPEPGGVVDCSPAVMTEFITWVFEQEAREQRKRDERARGKMLMQVALDRAAVHVSELDCKEWCRWVGYFLECLDALGMERGVHALDIDAVLTSVHKMVSERVCLGRW